jgi:hypothetical protein
MASVNAWKGVAYRWKALDLADVDFKKYVPDGRYSFLMEAALFSFFTCAVSSVEITYFAFYGLIAQLWPKEFGLISSNPRNVIPKTVLDAYATRYPAEPLTTVLRGVVQSDEYSDLAAIRHELSHRGTQTPGIFLNLPICPDKVPEAPPKPVDGWRTWRDMRLDATLTEGYRMQCSLFLKDLWSAASGFCDNHVAK